MRFLCWIVAWALLSCAANAASLRTEEGEIEGARFALACPANWRGNVLLRAHAYQPAETPLSVSLPINEPAYAALLDEGWLIAATSYRRSGLIVADAVADLDNLRAYLADKYGRLRHVLLEGESMGGLIVTLLAERAPADPPIYHGVLALSPALQLREPNSLGTGLTTEPRIPLLFVANQNELDMVKSYTRALLPPAARTLNAVAFRVAREGHLNFNQAERSAALRALIRWVEEGRDSLPAPDGDALFYDVTQTPAPQPSRVARHDDGHGFRTTVTGLSTLGGFLAIDAQPSDLERIGILRNSYFQITVREQAYRVYIGRDPFSMKRGTWIAFPHAEGFLWLGRTQLNAAQSAKIEVGDMIEVRRYDVDTPSPDTPNL